MIRSMFTAVNSLYVQQIYMDMVADNLSNVNTPGFKASYLRFKDQFSQLMRVGSAPNSTLGGVNPLQIGLGTNLGTVAPIFSQGALQSTGRELDLAISGDGFFVYTNGPTQYYSRDGSLAIDAEGSLVNSSTGERIMGWQADTAGGINTGGPLTGLKVPVDSTVAKESSVAYLLGNLDSNLAVPDPAAVPPVAAGTYDVTMGAYDKLGVLQSVTVRFTRATEHNWTWAAINGAAGNGTSVFDNNGQITSWTGDITITGSPGTSDTTVEMNLKGLTMLSAASSVALSAQDGLAAGSLMGFNIAANTGEVYGIYTNGDQRLIGQLALALFVNPSGLVRQGNNRYLSGLNSGEPRVGACGAGGRGSVSSGYIEGSNVEMSREFANMILAQRGFQASSRVITTSDQMLQELVNLAK